MKYDKLFVNGKIFTSDKDSLYAQAMAIKDGRIAWVGSDDKAKELANEAAEVIDLGSKRMLPGFVDCHMHAMLLADFSTQIFVLPPTINSIEDLVKAIAECNAERGPGVWIQGWGYDEGKLEEHRAPNRYDLDRGCSNAPVFVIRNCAHICVLNSYALEMAGITKDTPDPEGGKIGRDENGEPDGLLYENAIRFAFDMLPVKTDEMIVDDFIAMGDILLSQGLTTISDLDENPIERYSKIYWDAYKKGFKNRLVAYAAYHLIQKHGPEIITEDPAFNADDMFRIAGVKLIGDGSVSGRTAWCDEPYIPAEDGAPLEYGMPVCTDEEIKEALAFCKEHKCQLSIHVMGAQAIDRAVNNTWQEKNWLDNNIPGVRLEHVAMPTETAMERAAASDMAWSPQPIFCYAEIESYLKNLPLERIQESYPVSKWLDMGIRTALSTDTPATSWATASDPFVTLKSAVTRRAWDGTDLGQDYKIDLETALLLYTAESAPLLGLTDVGILKEDYVADFIVLDRDVLEVPADELDQVKVLETWIGGEKVYELSA